MTEKEFVTYNQIIYSLVQAEKAIKNVEDDGTCNFDTCMISVPEGFSRDEFNKFISENQLPIFENTFDNYYRIGRIAGQAYRNTLYAETLSSELNKLGYSSWVSYRMD